MRKVLLSIAAVVLSAGILAAQDLKQATDLYNNGATALNGGDKAGALNYFQQALTISKALTDDASKDLTSKLAEVIPSVSLSMATDLIKEAKYDEAVAKLGEVKALATEYKAEETLARVSELLPQVLMQKGNALFQAKDIAGATTAYKAVLEADGTNGMAAIRLGQCLLATGDFDGAAEAYKTAAANGQEKLANSQLSKLCLKKAVAALNAKSFDAAAAAALEANTYGENPQAYMIAGQACQKGNKNADAIKHFEKYLELAPTAKNAGQIAYTVGVLCQQSGDKAKAKKYYQMASSDPKLGADAAKLAAGL